MAGDSLTSEEKVAEFLQWMRKRAMWIRREYLNGGNFEHLRAREEECLYIIKELEGRIAP